MEGPEKEEKEEEAEEGFRTPERRVSPPEPGSVRQQIARVFADASLTPAQKFARVNALQGRSVPVPAHAVSDEVSSCPHYQRSCLLQCGACARFVSCRLCHPEMDENRFDVPRLKCVPCGHEQAPAADCEKCGIRFAVYVCTICHTYDSTPGKEIFHCHDCGICRIGTRETTSHCTKCNMCIVSSQLRDHACFENSFNQDCAACLQGLFHSTEGCSLLKCGHAMHHKCFSSLLETDYRCPTCKKAIADMSDQWAAMDEAMQAQMGAVREQLVDVPDELFDRDIQCLCNDCEIKFQRKFNPFNMYKCTQCDGFNTTPIQE